jgi:hypothetical protein
MPLAVSCSMALILRMICSGLWRIRYMLESQAQSGWMRTPERRPVNALQSNDSMKLIGATGFEPAT